MPPRRRLRRALGPLLALAALALAGCGAAAEEEGRTASVVWIVVDTLRADRLGCYGHERPTSPAIDALAGEGVVFERAYSTAPWTMPSVASMLTGLHPSRHGVTRIRRKLADELETLPETLARHGYRTGAVVSHLLIGAPPGFAQGFDVFHQDEARGHDHVSTPGVTAQARELLRELSAADEPFFLFVHYFDPHFRYHDHELVDWAAERVGSLEGGEPFAVLRARRHELSPDEVAFLQDLYDEEIRATDEGIGALLGELEALGLEDDTVVVLTADHGEEFLAHGWLGHTRTLFDELVRVPLVVRAPGVAPRRVGQPVSLAGLAPTTLDLVGLGRRAERPPYQGESFARLVLGGAEDPDAAAFAEVDFHDDGGPKEAHKKAIATARWKLVQDDETGAVSLYDLDADPVELVDVADRHPEVAAALLARLRDHLARVGADAAPEVDLRLSKDEIEELVKLGYIEGAR